MEYSSRRTGMSAWLAVCAGILFPAPLSGAADMQRPADEFLPVRVAPGLATGRRFIDVLLPYLGDFPEGLEGNQNADIRIRKSEDGYSVDILMSGYLDDSVRGEHFRGFVIPAAEGWELLSLGVKTMCWRGEAVAGICP